MCVSARCRACRRWATRAPRWATSLRQVGGLRDDGHGTQSAAQHTLKHAVPPGGRAGKGSMHRYARLRWHLIEFASTTPIAEAALLPPPQSALAALWGRWR